MNKNRDDLTAAEYVLGTLDEVNRQAFEARMLQDNDLKRQVAWWQRALGYVDLATPVETPPERVWSRIVARLPGQKKAKPWAFTSVTGWLVAAMLGCVLVFNYLQSPTESGTKQPIAVLNAADGKSQFVVFADRNRRVFSLNALNVTVADNHSLQLWAIAGNSAPVSLGLLRQDDDNLLPMPKDVLLNNITLAVSLEPKGGSKQAGPSGPVLYSGVLRSM